MGEQQCFSLERSPVIPCEQSQVQLKEVSSSRCQLSKVQISCSYSRVCVHMQNIPEQLPGSVLLSLAACQAVVGYCVNRLQELLVAGAEEQEWSLSAKAHGKNRHVQKDISKLGLQLQKASEGGDRRCQRRR
ncbi:uncharacterized protein LOC110477512 [Lonchura striata]